MLRCVCVEREDSATQRLGGVTVPLVEWDLPANKVYISVDSHCYFSIILYCTIY